ncbi:MAG: hypothetical protein IPI10_16135 [Bacteroidetes bacterium]|nr:hypothetical protein [Bacteroidota bacterium]
MQELSKWLRQSPTWKDVTITGEKADFVNSIDRKVYNMDKNIVNTGGM